MKTPLKSLALLLIGCFSLVGPQSKAATYTWTGISGGVWSDATNWTPNHVPTTGGDEALLGDVATGTRTVIWSASGAGVSTLSFQQVTAGATNLLDIQNNMFVSNSITVGASNGGTSILYVDPSSSGLAGHSVVLTVSGGINVNSGGVLALSFAGASGQYTPAIQGSIMVNGGAAIVYSNTMQTINSAGQASVTGSFGMTSGTLVVGAQMPGVTGSNLWDPRFLVGGNFNVTGGVISATTTYLGLNGSINNITGLSASTSRIGSLVIGGATQSFTCDSSATNNYISALGIRAGGNSTKTIGAATAGGTLAIGQIGFGQSAAGATTTVKLSSDLMATYFTPLSAAWGINSGVNTIGYALDLNGNNLFCPNGNVNLANYAAPSTGTCYAIWNLQNSGATSGTITANTFNFTSAAQVNVGLNSNSPVVLAAVGVGGTSNLGFTSSGTISANTVFAYIGSGGNLQTSGSARAIGRLAVGNGLTSSMLNLITGGPTIQGDITVNTNGVLNLLDKTVTETGAIDATAGGLNGNGYVYNNGGSGGTALLILNTYSADGSFSGVIGDSTTGKGKVAVTLAGGYGTQVFTGINVYTGATTINSGNTLQLGDGASDGVISGSSAITNNGLLWYRNAGTQVYSGTISGSGTAKMSGFGTQVLTGSNSYTGDTLISNGTLQIGDGGTTGALSKNSAITNDGTLVFNRSDTITQGADFSDTISGEGSVTQAGPGKLVLGGNNTYTGATIVSAGEMEINGSIADTSAVTVNSGATLGGSGVANGAVNVLGGTVKGNGLRIGDTSFSGASSISGTTTANSITVASGVTANSGVTTSTGNLAVSAGASFQNTGTAAANIVTVENTATLTNNGLINGSVNVSGLLNGTGTINGALTIKSAGELAPGNSPGITTVNGDLTVETGAKISMQISGVATPGTDYDQIVVTGASSMVTLNAGSILTLTFDAVLTAGQTLTIIKNESNNLIVGTFSSVVVGGNTYNVSGSNAFTYNGQNYELSYNVNTDSGSIANDLELIVVPEPATWAMLVGGVGMLLGARRLRRRSA